MSSKNRNEQPAIRRRRRLGLSAPRSARRGVLLLVILSMLVVFLMTAVAFVVVARHYERAAKATSKIERLDEPAQELLEAALHDILRDTKNPHSRVRYHSLLQDMYGTDGIAGEVLSPKADMSASLMERLVPKYVGALKSNGAADLLGETAGQIVEFAVYDHYVINPDDPEGPKDLFGAAHPLVPIEHYYNGHVLTWTSGPLTGQSMRVVGYRSELISGFDPNPATPPQDPVFFVQVLATDSAGLGPFTPTPRNDPQAARRVRSPEIKELVRFPFSPSPVDQNGGHRFVLNGRPFNGTGSGYNRLNPPPAGILSNAMELLGPGAGLAPVALLPNPAFFAADKVVLPGDPDIPPLYAKYFLTDGQITSVLTSGLPPAQQNQLLLQLSEQRGLAGLGGMDEGYDAPDYQNMLLAYMPMNPTIPSGFTTAPGGTGPAYQTLADPDETDRIVQPSLHRTALINYWIKNQNASYVGGPNERWQAWHSDALRLDSSQPAMNEKALARKVVLRPLPFDHPHFPQIANLIYGPWDVDNDGDGVPDSIWVDLGYPPVKTADGRFYKPMFAILVQDLDGRLNLNAHGSLQEAVVGRSQHEDQVVLASPTTAMPPLLANKFAPGVGYGPAEISLYPMLLATNNGNQTAATLQYQQLLRGQLAGNNILIPGRYGRENVPVPGAGPRWDLRAQMKFREYPLMYLRNLYANNIRAQQMRSAFTSPPDLMGRYAVGVDFTGFPNFAIYSNYDPNATIPNEPILAESPYEKNLLGEGPRTVLEQAGPGGVVAGEDTLFTVAELERLLRKFDADVGQLPSRLTALAGSLFDAARAVTTRSFDLPVPNVAPLPKQVARFRTMQNASPPEFDPGNPTVVAQVERIVTAPRNVEELVIARIMLDLAEAKPQPVNLADLQLATESARRLVSADLRDNLRLDINRPFGNGRDDDGDGAVDDPDEARRGIDALVGPLRNSTALQSAQQARDDPTRAYAVAITDVARRDNDEVAALDGDPSNLTAEDWSIAKANARQYTARELFILLMLLKDEDYFFEFGDELILPHTGTLNPADEKSMTTRRLAQWAVNAVDFRDADAIMTGFEVDIDPFVDNDPSIPGTWDVDGDLRTIEMANGTPAPWRAVVWGLERPQALITETLATHDLRVIDSSNDNGPRGGARRDENETGDYDPPEDDEDQDQFRIPQGSLFLELYCTGNPTNNVQPGELYEYDSTAGKWMLNLGRRPLDPRTGSPDPNPVWRLAITELHLGDRAQDAQLSRDSAYRQFLTNPEAVSFQPDQPANMGLMERDDYRYVWFTPEDPRNLGNRVPEPDRIFWNTGVLPAIVPAGQYAVIGPRHETFFGSQGLGIDRTPAGQSIVFNEPSLHARSVIVENDAGNVQTPYAFDISNDGSGQVKAAYGIVVGMRKDVNGWSDNAEIGLNISEPLPDVTGQYYRQPTEAIPGGGYDAVLPLQDRTAYGSETDSNARLPDEPFDLVAGRPIAELAERTLRLIGTHEDIRTVFLQRLADPTMPWNPAPDDPKYGNPAYGQTNLVINLHDPTLPVNPYITVDWQPLDLTVFNGEERDAASAQWDRDDSNYVSEQLSNATNSPRFSTRERGLVEPGETSSHNIWRAESARTLRSSARVPGMMGYFKYALRHSLGYVNETYGVPVQLPDGPAQDDYRRYVVPSPEAHNARALALGAPADPNTPDVAKPFPWLAWNDRPYVSELEFLQVPISEPGRLTVEHTMATQDNNFDPYDPESFAEEFRRAWDGSKSLVDVEDGPDRMYRYSNGNSTFGHLLNFQAATDPQDTSTPPEPAPNFHRLLEYVAVPSRFVGTETFLNPEVFSSPSASTEYRRPPFNRISQYREPGRMNLNTIYDQLIYRGLFHGDPATGAGTTPPAHPGPEWQEFIKSRRGYQMSDPVLDNAMFPLHDDYPTFFAGHFGPPDSGHLVPLADSLPAGTASDIVDGMTDMRRAGTDMGLLRRDANHMPANEPLFRDHTNPNVATNPQKHSYFHYQAAQRLANLTTSRSNVYAVWVTVGFFEMAPVDDAHRQAMVDNHPQNPAVGQALFDRLYPEGMWLGQEAGSDTGQTQRYRAFYIIDRSIPVAYEPGKNHNVENAVILRRRLE